MGRLSRHRKIKSCDPFYRGQKENDMSYNAPVKPTELDSQPVSKRVKDLLKKTYSRKVDRKEKNVIRNNAKKCKVNLDLQRREGETRKEYFARLDQQAAQKVAQIITKERHISQKRKEFLKARKEKLSKKRRNFEKEYHLDFKSDNVKFGEVVNEPPSFTAKPRHAELKQDARSRSKVDSLLLRSKLTTYQCQQNEDVNRNLLRSKKRKHMSAIEQQVSDKRRMEAIEAYRKLKKKPTATK